MQEAQRIVYLHVSVTWCGLTACLAMGACSAIYMIRRPPHPLPLSPAAGERGRGEGWDHWSQACAEISLLCLTVTLATGSLWAHQAWGVWWTWEPRLTSALVLWLILAGICLARAGVDDPQRRARIGAVLAVFAVADLPLVVLATHWFRGVHPVNPQMDPRMRVVLLAAMLGFTVFFVFLARQRRQQITLAAAITTLENRLDMPEQLNW